MSTSPTIDQIDTAQREAIDALARGEAPAAVARGSGRSAEEVLELARQGMDALAADAGDGLSPRDRAFAGDYVLGLQSPGQAEGTWRLLESSPAAAQWAQRVRDALAESGVESQPLPTDEGALSPSQRVRRSRSETKKPTLGEQRRERSRRRTAANAQEAAAEMLSPFRSEAVEAHQAADDRIELPRWAPRPAQLSMYGVLVALLVGLGFAIVVRIPVNTNAVVLVTDVPAGAPGSANGGLQIIALFPQSSGQSKDAGSGEDVEAQDILRVALPGESSRVPTRIRWVSSAPQSPRDIVDRYRLPLGQANRVASPSHVALAQLLPPPGKAPKRYEGTTTTEASVQTGSRRIISLLFG